MSHAPRRRSRRFPSALAVFAVLVYGFIMAPLIVIIASSFTSAGYVSFPPIGFSLRWYEEILGRPEFLESFQVSVVIAIVSAGGATLVGTSAALAVARYDFPGRALLATFFLSPLMLPTIVIGIALLIFVNGLGVPRTMWGLVVGHIVITVPFVIRLVGASLAGFDQSLERAAINLGASPWTAFRKITLPIIKSGVAAGAAFAAIVSFDDISVALFMSSPSATTLPVRIFTAVEQSYSPLVPAVSSVTIVLMLILLVLIERSMGLRTLYQIRTRQ